MLKHQGENNPFYGKRHTEETKNKIRATIANGGGRSGKLNANYGNHVLRGHRMTREQCMKISLSKRGKLNPAWIDGRSYKFYPGAFSERTKRMVRERDNNKCSMCGISGALHMKKHGRNLDVHHIDYNRANCNIDNLVALCQRCNLKVNKNRVFYQKKLSKFVKSHSSKHGNPQNK